MWGAEWGCAPSLYLSWGKSRREQKTKDGLKPPLCALQFRSPLMPLKLFEGLYLDNWGAAGFRLLSKCNSASALSKHIKQDWLVLHDMTPPGQLHYLIWHSKWSMVLFVPCFLLQSLFYYSYFSLCRISSLNNAPIKLNSNNKKKSQCKAYCVTVVLFALPGSSANSFSVPDCNSEVLTSSAVGYLTIYLVFLVILSNESELFFRNAI